MACAWVVSLGVSGLGRADILTDWNNAELNHIRLNAVDPFFASRDLAILQVAVFDAVNGVNVQDAPFYVSGSVANASAGAAAAAAAYQVMTNLYGANSTLQALYNSHIASLADTPTQIANGISRGVSVANTITTYRGTDGAATANSPYTGPSGQGYWAPTPPSNSAALLPGWGQVTPFAMNTGTQFRPNAPPAIDSAKYVADFNEVKAVGASNSATRTSDQTSIANFWNASPGTVTTAGQWNQVAQAVSGNLTLNEKAKVFAAINVAMADATIAAADSKYAYSFWRPVSAIRDEFIRDGGVAYNNQSITGDASWTPLLRTPNSPDYLSENSAMSKAAASALANLFNGDLHAFNLGSDVDGDGVVDMTRSYGSFSQAALEAGLSRIYAGVSFRSSVIDGATVGNSVGILVASNFFTPVPEPSGALCILTAGLFLIVKRRRWTKRH